MTLQSQARSRLRCWTGLSFASTTATTTASSALHGLRYLRLDLAFAHAAWPELRWRSGRMLVWTAIEADRGGEADGFGHLRLGGAGGCRDGPASPTAG